MSAGQQIGRGHWRRTEHSLKRYALAAVPGAAFLAGRYLARDRVARWAAADPRFEAIDAIRHAHEPPSFVPRTAGKSC